MPLQMSMSKLMGVYSNYKLPKFYEIIYIVAFGVGLKCPRKIHLNTQRPPLGSGITALWKTLYELRTLCIDAEIFGPHGLMGRFRAKIYQEHTKAFSSMMFTLNILWLIWQKMILSNQVMSSALTYFLMKKLFCIKPIYLFALTLMNRDGKGLFTF